MTPRIVILDGNLANPGDLTWDLIDEQGELIVFSNTDPQEIISRATGADVLVVNKVRLDAAIINQLPNLKLICLLATGFDNVDIEAARHKDIDVCNAVAYGVDSVVEHVFAMIFSWYRNIDQHNASIQKGEWSSHSWSYTLWFCSCMLVCPRSPPSSPESASCSWVRCSVISLFTFTPRNLIVAENCGPISFKSYCPA